jgi:acyl-CoA reductase-like NAD-dependent aldehyde dehydrogenase
MAGMLLDGQVVAGGRARAEVRDPFRDEVVDTVPIATAADIETAVAAGVEGAREMAALPAHERAAILNRAADLIAGRVDDLARTLTREEGKPLAEATGEVARIPDLLRLCAFEGTQLRGETLPLDAHKGAEGKVGFTFMAPVGLIVAITPFNYPMLLVVHKLGPALAAGNAVILKPASATPLTALALCALLLQAGLPPRALQCLTGPGADVAAALVADPRVRLVTFTGSAATGDRLSRTAGPKRLLLELGSNCPMVVLADADLELAATATTTGGYVNAGQVCISVQRVIVDRSVQADYLDALLSRVKVIAVGDPLAPGTRLASMINATEAIRVQSWIAEAVGDGATLATGGERDGAVMTPAVVTGVLPGMRIAREELFGPAVAVMAAEGVEDAMREANAGGYGLSAAVFTSRIADAFRFARGVDTGMVMVNSSPLWRADLMPYGGRRASGFGREGPRSLVHEMTEPRTVVFHGVDQ